MAPKKKKTKTKSVKKSAKTKKKNNKSIKKTTKKITTDKALKALNEEFKALASVYKK